MDAPYSILNNVFHEYRYLYGVLAHCGQDSRALILGTYLLSNLLLRVSHDEHLFVRPASVLVQCWPLCSAGTTRYSLPPYYRRVAALSIR